MTFRYSWSLFAWGSQSLPASSNHLCLKEQGRVVKYVSLGLAHHSKEGRCRFVWGSTSAPNGQQLSAGARQSVLGLFFILCPMGMFMCAMCHQYPLG